MGVIVEGIKFFGLQGLYLFLTDNSAQINAKGTFSTFVIFFYIIQHNFFFNIHLLIFNFAKSLYKFIIK